MSSEETKNPWKNGYWYNKQWRFELFIIEGDKINKKNSVCLENPDTITIETGTMTYGEFGSTNTEILEATCTENYNLGNKTRVFQFSFLIC